MNFAPDHARVAFGSTCWSIVHRVGGDSPEDSHAALSALCESYWYPIYVFVRNRGYSHHDASDLTQGFFAFLVEQNRFRQLDPARGKFRAFLLASVKNYLSDERRKSTSLKRGGAMTQVPLEVAEFDQRYRRQFTDDCSPEDCFKRSWAEALLSRVLQLLRRDYERAGKLELFMLLSEFLVAAGNTLPQAELASRLEISVPAVTMSLQRMRKRYVAILRQELAQTVLEPGEVDDELRDLKSTLTSTASAPGRFSS